MDGMANLGKIPKDAEIILYCNSGSRANFVGSILNRMGYDDVACMINKEYVESEYGLA